MKLSELIAEYGDSQVVMQTLDDSIINMSKKKSHVEYTFGSFESFNIDGTEKVGMVIWLNRDRVKKIMGEDDE